MPRIFVVDDVARVLGMLREPFKEGGYEMVEAQPTIPLHVSRFTLHVYKNPGGEPFGPIHQGMFFEYPARNSNP